MASKLPDMGKMVGPLPLGAWVVLVGGGVTFMVISRRNANTAIQDAAATDPDMMPEDTSGTPGVGVGGSGLWTDVATPTTGVTNTPAKPSNNDEWGTAAITYLTAAGYNAFTADSAIRKYLSGDATYSTQEYAMVLLAITHVGPTPTVLPAPTIPGPSLPGAGGGGGTVPKPSVPRPSANIRYYTVKRGDTLAKIANRYYHNPKETAVIFNANRWGTKRADGTPGMIAVPTIIRGGWKLIIP